MSYDLFITAPTGDDDPGALQARYEATADADMLAPDADPSAGTDPLAELHRALRARWPDVDEPACEAAEANGGTCLEYYRAAGGLIISLGFAEADALGALITTEARRRGLLVYDPQTATTREADAPAEAPDAAPDGAPPDGAPIDARALIRDARRQLADLLVPLGFRRAAADFALEQDGSWIIVSPMLHHASDDGREAVVMTPWVGVSLGPISEWLAPGSSRERPDVSSCHWWTPIWFLAHPGARQPGWWTVGPGPDETPEVVDVLRNLALPRARELLDPQRFIAALRSSESMGGLSGHQRPLALAILLAEDGPEAELRDLVRKLHIRAKGSRYTALIESLPRFERVLEERFGPPKA